MNISKRIFIFTFILLLLMLEANALVSKEYCSTMTGTAVGVQGMFRKWLEVKSNKEGVMLYFRIGRDTIYTPHRYPFPGEQVKVEYCQVQGVNVGYTVTILGEPK